MVMFTLQPVDFSVMVIGRQIDGSLIAICLPFVSGRVGVGIDHVCVLGLKCGILQGFIRRGFLCGIIGLTRGNFRCGILNFCFRLPKPEGPVM